MAEEAILEAGDVGELQVEAEVVPPKAPPEPDPEEVEPTRLFLVFRRTGADFPLRTQEAAYAKPAAFAGDPDVIAIPWSPNEDRVAGHYMRVEASEGLLYSPPLPPPPAANLDAFNIAIARSADIPPAVKFQLFGVMPTWDKLVAQPGALATSWSEFKSVFNVDQPVADTVEALASAAFVPLT